LEYLSKKSFLEKYIDQLYEPADIVIPVQNTVDEQTFFTIPYQTLMFVQDVSIIAKKVKNPPKDMMSTLFWSILKTWPLLMMAVSMAMAAGCIIWLLVCFHMLYSPRYFFPLSSTLPTYFSFLWRQVFIRISAVL